MANSGFLLVTEGISQHQPVPLIGKVTVALILLIMIFSSWHLLTAEYRRDWKKAKRLAREVIESLRVTGRDLDRLTFPNNPDSVILKISADVRLISASISIAEIERTLKRRPFRVLDLELRLLVVNDRLKKIESELDRIRRDLYTEAISEMGATE